MLLPIAGGTISYFYSINQAKVYEAKTTLLVQQRRAGNEAGVSDFNLSQQLAKTFGRQVESTPFLERVSSKSDVSLSLGKLQKMVSSSTDRQPPTVDVKVQHTDPRFAYETANMLGAEFIEYVLELRLTEIAKLQAAAASQGLVNVQDMVSGQFGLIDSLSVLEPASIPNRPVLPQTSQNLLIGIVLGMALGVGTALFLNSLSDTVRDAEELSKKYGVTALGTVFKWASNEFEDNDLVTAKAPSSGYSESFKQVRANIQFATTNLNGNVLIVTSPGPSEGKTTVISNLAVSFSQLGKKIIVIDGDMRRPATHRLLVESGAREPGLSNYLSDSTVEIKDVIHKSPVDGIQVIPGGPIPPNPSELLESERMSTMIEGARKLVDIVLIDSPPVLVVADGPILSSKGDGVVLVVDGFSTRSSSLKATIESLQASNANVIGAVINKLKRARFGYRYSYPYYYDYYYYGYGQNTKGKHSNRSKTGIGRPIKWLKSMFSRSDGSKS